MNCNECQELLAGYIEEVLDEATRAAVESHLRECPECQAQAAEFSQLRDQLVAGGSTYQRTSLEEQVMNRIARQGAIDSRRFAMFKRYARTTAKFAMAAAVIAAVGAFFFTGLRGQSANAAEMLKAAAAANKAFNGWIRATMDNPESLNRPHEGLVITAATFYLQPVKQIVVKDATINGVRTVDWMDHVANVHKSYDSASNTITEGPLPDAEKADGASVEEMTAKMLSGQKATPWQFAQLLFGMPTLDGVMALVDSNLCSVSMAREGDNDRYTLTFNKDRLTNPKDADRASLVLLVNRKTSLMHKWVGTFPDGNMSLTFAYNDPVLNDIRDVGLPADAKVNDPRAATTRPAADAEALLDRLDKMAAMDEQLGTYTVVVAESFDYSDKRKARREMTIYGRDGKRQFYGFYANQERASFLTGLADWPLPAVADAVVAARNVQPDIVLAADGTGAWYGRADRGKTASWWPVQMKDLGTHQWIIYSLAGELWPGRHKIDYEHGSRIKIDVQTLTSPDRPGLVGVQVDQTGLAMAILGTSKMQFVWWVDPLRNDVMVEKVKRTYSLKGDVAYEEVTKYTEYGQLPNGLWYPTARQMIGSRYLNGTPEIVVKAESRLQFVPGMALDAEWFSNPQDRYEAAASQPAASQPGQVP